MPKYHLRRNDFVYECPCGYERGCNDKKILDSVSKRHRQFCEVAKRGITEARAVGIKVDGISGHIHQINICYK